MLPTCWSDPPVVKLNWWPPHDEYKPSATPSVTSPTGCTHFPLVVWIKLPLSSLNSSLVYNKTDVSRVTVNFCSFRHLRSMVSLSPPLVLTSFPLICNLLWFPFHQKKKPHSSFISGKEKGKARFFHVYKFSGKSLLKLLAEMCLPWFMFYFSNELK